MKRILSILLCSLMVLSSIGTVAFAEDTITFAPIMTFAANDIIKAGSKVRFTVEAAEGAEVTYKNNGAAATYDVVVADVEDDGKFTQTVALTVNAGVNVFTAETASAASAATTIKAVAYEETVVYDDDDLATAFGTKITTAEGTFDGVTNPYYVNSGNRVLNGSLPTDAEILVQSVDFYCADFLTMTKSYYGFPSVYVTGSYVDGDGATQSKAGTMNPLYVYKDNARIDTTSNNVVPDGGADVGTGFILSGGKWHNATMYLNPTTGVFDYYVDGIMVLKNVQGTSVWSSYKLTWDTINSFYLANNEDIYLNNYSVKTASKVTTSISIDEDLSGDVAVGTEIPVEVKNLAAGQKVVAYVNGVKSELTPVDGEYAIETVEGPNTIYAAIENADGSVATDVLTGAELKTGKIYLNESAISIDTTVSGDVPAGTKVGITVANLAAGNKVVAYVNGVATDITPVNGTYGATVAAGYNTIYAAITDAQGNILKDFDGADLKTAAVSCYGLSLDADSAEWLANNQFAIDDDYDDIAITPVKDGDTVTDYTITGVSMTGNLNNAANRIAAIDTNKTFAAADRDGDGTNDSIKLTRTNSAYTYLQTNPSVSYLDFSLDIKFTEAPPAGYTGGYEMTHNNSRFLLVKQEGTETNLFGIDKYGVLYALAYDFDGTTYTANYKLLSDIDYTEWHTYSVKGDAATDKIWLYVDGVLVHSGYTRADITKFNSWQINAPRPGSTSYQLTMQVDNLVLTGVRTERNDTAAFAAKAEEAAFINVTANGLGLLPANLAAADQVANLAIIAQADDDTVEVHKYDASNPAAGDYEYITFTKEAAKIFVWDWATLRPIQAVYTID